MLGSQQPTDQPLVDIDLRRRNAAMLDEVVIGHHSPILRRPVLLDRKRHALATCANSRPIVLPVASVGLGS
jgi:hypothetical protein